jgi:hypothetical protein
MSKTPSKSKAGTAFADIGRRRPPAATSIAAQVGGRPRGNASKVGIQLRLSHAQWRKVQELAMQEKVSIQGLTIYALDQVFKTKGFTRFAALKDADPTLEP